MSIAQNVTGLLTCSASFTQIPTGLLAGSQGFTQTLTSPLQFNNAVGVNFGVDQMYSASFSLASTTSTVHVQNASLKDPFGNTLAMLRIRLIMVLNTETTLTHILKVYAPASNAVPWLPPVANFLTVPPGGVLLLTDPLSFGGGVGLVTASSADGIEFDSGSNTVAFQVLVGGTATA